MSTPTRAPAGTPEGGRFAPGQHAEPGVTLVSNRPPDRESLVDQLAGAHRAAGQAKRRVSLLSARLLADEIAAAYPQATHVRVHRNGYEPLPAAIESVLDENGADIADAAPAEPWHPDDAAQQLLSRWDHVYVEHLDLDGATRGLFLTGDHPAPRDYGDYVDVLDIGKAQNIVPHNSTKNGSS